MDQDKIEKRIKQLDAQKQTLKARLRTQQRKHDTRRKILLGALLLDRIEQNNPRDQTIITWTRQQLPGFLTRPNDHKLFEDLFNDDSDKTTDAQDSNAKQDEVPAP